VICFISSKARGTKNELGHHISHYGNAVRNYVGAQSTENQIRPSRRLGMTMRRFSEQIKSFEAALADQGEPLPSEADLARKFPRMITSVKDMLDGPESC
jgi:hypothetical protein